MKALDQDEKNFLLALIEMNERTGTAKFASLIDPLLENKEIYVHYPNQVAEIRFDQNHFLDNPDLVDIVRSTSWQIIKYSNLLEYLAEINYLYLYQEAQLEDEFSYGQLAQGNVPITRKIEDPAVIRNLIFVSYRTIVVGQPLLDYVDAGFYTEDELRHNENIKIGEQSLAIGRKSIDKATTAIWISIGLGLISIAVSIYLSLEDKTQKNEINNIQIKEILNNNSSSTGKIIEEIRSQRIVLPDTTLTKIVEPIELKEKVKHTTKPK